VLAVVPSGSNVTGPRPAEPLGFNDVSPLMARLFAEVAHAAAGMTRAQTAPIVEALYSKYKDKLIFDEAPKGRPFQELYDVDTLTPTPEHQAVYDAVKEELIRLGVPLT
jgi:methylamine--corrinoid protein Co-methyltransferase